MKEFLEELAALQEKHKIAICTSRSDASVVYESYCAEKRTLFNTNRCHSAAYETRLHAKQYVGGLLKDSFVKLNVRADATLTVREATLCSRTRAMECIVECDGNIEAAIKMARMR